MRFALVSVASCLMALGSLPARADPAYTADAVADFFVAQSLGGARAICVGTAEECDAQLVEEEQASAFDLLVTFDFNSDDLTPAARQNLDEFAEALQDPRLSGERFAIEGHTDATGSERYNQDLSQRRADAVLDYLASLGVNTENLEAAGYGMSRPRADDPFDPENRRVETRLVSE